MGSKWSGRNANLLQLSLNLPFRSNGIIMHWLFSRISHLKTAPPRWTSFWYRDVSSPGAPTITLKTENAFMNKHFTDYSRAETTSSINNRRQQLRARWRNGMVILVTGRRYIGFTSLHCPVSWSYTHTQVVFNNNWATWVNLLLLITTDTPCTLQCTVLDTAGPFSTPRQDKAATS